MSARSLAGALRNRGLVRLAEWAESLTAERDAALLQNWIMAKKIERLQDRVHELAARRNSAGR